MPAREHGPATPRALVVGHASTATAGVNAARALYHGQSALEIDVLAFGSGIDALELPSGAQAIALFPTRKSSFAMFRQALTLILRLRRRGYELAVVSQPHLELSRMRGPLKIFPFLVGSREVHTPPGTDPISRRGAAADFAQWLGFQLVGAVLTPLLVLSARAARLLPRGRLRPSNGTDLLYLRTDLELKLSPLIAGGSAAHTTGILSAFLNRGFGAELWTTGEISGVPPAVTTRRLPGVMRGNLPLELGELASGLIQTVRVAPGRRPAFIYQRNSLNNLAGIMLRRRFRVPLLLEANASEVKWRRDAGTLRFGRLAAACEALVLKHADLVVAVSDNAATDLRAAGAPPERLRVVPNGVDFHRFAEAEPAVLPFPEGTFVLAFSGLFYPWHGVRHLGEAFALFHKKCPDSGLLLIGDGEEAPVLRQVLHRARVGDAAHWVGLVHRSHVPGYMTAADVLVSPHAADDDFIGSPIKIFEYMASGRAIVASDFAQMGQVLRDGVTALLVPPADPDAMAASFELLYSNPELRARLGKAAQDEAQALHSWDARVADILAGAPIQ